MMRNGNSLLWVVGLLLALTAAAVGAVAVQTVTLERLAQRRASATQARLDRLEREPVALRELRRREVAEVAVAQDRAVRLVQTSRPNRPEAPEFVRDWVSWGAGTRGTQNLVLAAKARALLKGRFHVACADLRAVAAPVLRHRILTNFRAEADGVTVETIIDRLLETVKAPGDAR